MTLDFKTLNTQLQQKCRDLSIAATARWLYVSIASQQLWLLEDDNVILQLVCSTSKNPPSCVADSLGTPTGIHAIAAKIGCGAPAGAVFKGRVRVADHFNQLPETEQQTNLITSRILRLKGMEPGHNAEPKNNAWERFVYVHGTNHPQKLGQPFSAGCVLLSDPDVINLYDQVSEGDLLWIAH
jgi:hypothetical protein